MKLTDFIIDAGRPVTYYPAMAPVYGGVVPAVFISQLIYWQGRGSDPEWVYKTQAEWSEETGLIRSEQETARRELRRRGFLSEERRGIPARLYYHANLSAINEAWEHYRENGPTAPDDDGAANKDAESCKLECGILQTGMQDRADSDAESCKQDGPILQSPPFINRDYAETTQSVQQRLQQAAPPAAAVASASETKAAKRRERTLAEVWQQHYGERPRPAQVADLIKYANGEPTTVPGLVVACIEYAARRSPHWNYFVRVVEEQMRKREMPGQEPRGILGADNVRTGRSGHNNENAPQTHGAGQEGPSGPLKGKMGYSLEEWCRYGRQEAESIEQGAQLYRQWKSADEVEQMVREAWEAWERDYGDYPTGIVNPYKPGPRLAVVS